MKKIFLGENDNNKKATRHGQQEYLKASLNAHHGRVGEAHGDAPVVGEEAVRAPRVHLRRRVRPVHLPWKRKTKQLGFKLFEV